jgi:hypothetical protein
MKVFMIRASVILLALFCVATVMADGDRVSFQSDYTSETNITILPHCGDGYIQYYNGETCDPPGEPAPNGNICREDCTYCGDGFQDEGEECDDGDTDDLDECSNDCTYNPTDEGCTPGYWKNKRFAWAETAYTTDMLVGDLFTLPNGFTSLGDATLLEALSWSSGELPIDKAANLIKHAVAALLNASHPDVDYPEMVGDIIAAVNAALDGGDPDVMDDLHMDFDDANNAGCPLSGRPPQRSIDKVVERDESLKRSAGSRVNDRDVSGPVDLQLN